MTELEEQRKRAVETGRHLKDQAATCDLEDDRERHILELLAEVYVAEQTRYEYMKLRAGSQNPPQSPFDKGGSEAGGFVGAAA